MALFSDKKLSGRFDAFESSLSQLAEGQKTILSLLQASAGKKEDEKMKGKKPMESGKEDPNQNENDADPVAGGAGSEPEKAGTPERDPVDGEAEGSEDEEPMHEPVQNEGETNEDPDSEEEEEETEAEQEADEEQGEDEESEEEPTSTPPKPKTGKKEAKASKTLSLAAEVADLKAQLSELTQKGLAQAAANIGIKPIARADKAENAPDEADPVKRTYANWSRPIKAGK